MTILNELEILATLTEAGSPLLRTLRVIDKSSGRATWAEVCKEIEGGATMSEALNAHPLERLSPYENKLLRIFVHAGELSGCLETTLQRVVEVLKSGKEMSDGPQFLNILGMFLNSGIPCLMAIKSVPDFTPSFTVLKDRVHALVKEGETFAQGFEESKLFPPYVLALIDIGEQTGALPYCLKQASELMDKIES